MKKLFVLMVLLGVLFIVFISPGNTVEAQADDSMRMNERKYFTSYVVEKGDTLWDIAEQYMTPEYESVNCYIREVMESNHLEHTVIKQGQLLILPYYADEPMTDL
ncbi:LysM peptidoglycan-binding domain-containing protein [Frisingicoccus sp.]|jgi:hypothetical protein|uniref:LysM peptidoglycan-binding domain-containing protein n=1 Tax=Frisingicoccus sp. TaxID=1918627 RepID=UPI0015BFCD4C